MYCSYSTRISKGMLWEARTTFSLRVNAATKEALCGDPRRRIQLDLLECHNFLKCSCCSKSSNASSSSMHDTTLMYTFTQEHGDLINLHDWYQSLKQTDGPRAKFLNIKDRCSGSALHGAVGDRCQTGRNVESNQLISSTYSRRYVCILTSTSLLDLRNSQLALEYIHKNTGAILSCGVYDVMDAALDYTNADRTPATNAPISSLGIYRSSRMHYYSSF
ncbi:origin recognition complex subunit 3 [Tanacetum coccineum]